MRVRRRSHLTLGLAGDGQEELELGRELVFGVESVREVDSANTAVGVDLNSIVETVMFISELCILI